MCLDSPWLSLPQPPSGKSNENLQHMDDESGYEIMARAVSSVRTTKQQ